MAHHKKQGTNWGQLTAYYRLLQEVRTDNNWEDCTNDVKHWQRTVPLPVPLNSILRKVAKEQERLNTR